MYKGTRVPDQLVLIDCVRACRAEGTSLMIYGRKNRKACYNGNKACYCYCYTNVKKEGECERPEENLDFDLYKIQEGEIITVKLFSQ